MSVVQVKFPGNLAQVDGVADLRALPSANFADGDLYSVKQIGGLFAWNPSSLATDDNETALKPNDLTPLQVGRWILGSYELYNSVISETIAPISAAVANKIDTTNALTTNFISNASPVKIQRLNDRMLLGGATLNDAEFPNVTKDWLSAFETTIGARANGTMVSAQAGILNNDYFGAGVGLLTGVRTLNFISAATGASGHSSVAVNNNASLQTNAWAFYGEGHRVNDSVGSVYGMELDVSNFGSLHAITPYAQDAKETVILQLAAGSEYPTGGQSPISAYVNIRDNNNRAQAGIVFGATSLVGTDGTDADSGTANAMLLGRRHRITWSTPDGNDGGSIQSNLTSANRLASKMRLAFDDLGFLVLGPTDNISLIIRPVQNVTNYLDYSPGQTGIAPLLRASGTDTDVDLAVQPQGIGLLRFSNATSMVANGAVATALGSLGPTGASTNPRKWLSVKDATGTQLYIPCF